MDLVRDKVVHVINNSNCIIPEDKRVDISNGELYTHPYRKHQYEIELKDLEVRLYICNAQPVKGTFENMIFDKHTFFDCTTFKNVVFKNCLFIDADVRWCKFENCQFIDCQGNFYQARGTTWKKGCTYENSELIITSIDQYIFINGKRYNEYYNNIKLQYEED